MVIDNFDFICVPFLPEKADTPLSVHAYAAHPHSVTGQLLESVSRRNSQASDRNRGIQYLELHPCSPAETAESSYIYVVEQLLGIFAPEGLYHVFILLRLTSHVNTVCRRRSFKLTGAFADVP